MNQNPSNEVLPPSVLVVDDRAANRQLMLHELEAVGYRVLQAGDGREAIRCARLERPDLVLMDVLMPGIDGFEACRELKDDPATADIPVIFMTALADTSQKVTGFDLGAVDYVTKPLDFNEVLARVRTQIALSTMRRQLAAQNLELQREIAAHEKTQAALRRSNTELEQLAYVASHDMQEPLRMVASYLQLLEQRYPDKLDDDGREFIGYAVDGAKRMQVLINDLLAYSRVGTQARPFAPVRLGDIVDGVRHQLQVAIAERGARIEQGELPTVQGDAVQLSQLFQNLIANAVKFHRDEPTVIEISCRAAPDEWVVTVQDNGIGIEPQYFQRIFVLFQRLHGRSEYPGTGIGLALCKKIVERHGGRIWVESTPGRGTSFHFSLPRASAADAPAGAAA